MGSGAGRCYLPAGANDTHATNRIQPTMPQLREEAELKKMNQAFRDVESCRNHLAKHKPSPVWMFWRWFLILNLGTVLTVSAMSIEAREAELVWQTMWEEKPHVVEFKFNPEIREFKARVR